jgi:hypothetical protein
MAKHNMHSHLVVKFTLPSGTWIASAAFSAVVVAAEL